MERFVNKRQIFLRSLFFLYAYAHEETHTCVNCARCACNRFDAVTMILTHFSRENFSKGLDRFSRVLSKKWVVTRRTFHIYAHATLIFSHIHTYIYTQAHTHTQNRGRSLAVGRRQRGRRRAAHRGLVAARREM